MTLVEFIKSKGDEQCASLWGVPVRTVASWRRGERTPRPSKAREIAEATGGEVTLGEIYSEPAPA